MSNSHDLSSVDGSQKTSDVVAPPPRRSRWRRFRHYVILAVFAVGIVWFAGVPTIVLKHLAQRQLKRGRPYEAIAWLTKAAQLSEADAELEFLLARTYRLQGDLNQVRTHLERAWKLGYPVQKLEREQILAKAQSGQLGSTEPALSAMLVDPRGDTTDICEAFVVGYIRNYRLPQAEQLLAAWLADSPQQPRALLLRAKMQIDLQNWNAAEGDLRRVLSSVPEHAEAADILAGVLLKQKQAEAALKVLPIAIKDSRTRLSARLREIECHRIKGEGNVARNLLTSILNEFPDNVQALLELGTIDSDVGKFELAVVPLKRAQVLAPNSPEVRYALAIALRGSGHEDEAKEHFDFVIRAREAVAEVMNLRSTVEQRPRDAELRYRIGKTLLDYGQEARGVVWLQSALDVNSALIPAHERLADYYESRAKESDEFAKLAIEHRKLASMP